MSGLPAVPPPQSEPEPASPEAGPSERDRELLRYFIGLAWAAYLRDARTSNDQKRGDGCEPR